MRNRNHVKACLLVFPMLGVFTFSTLAQEKADFDAPALYKALCASCHGLKGDGDGPVAGALKVKIKPLSTLAKRNGGVFPKDYVYRTIDGREDIKAHGDRKMPVWGSYYREKHIGAGADASADTITRFLVQYIKSLQVE
jgi:mono/diheme cytochrome c family protein